MKPIILLLLLFLLSACATKPYLKNKLMYEKISDDCAGLDPKFKMNSNLNGERYEFQRCLESTFNGKKYSAERKGDTVVIRFSKLRAKTKPALFNITIDIDAYPRYNFMTIDGETFQIIPAGN